MSDAGPLAELRTLLVERGAVLVECADLAPVPADARRGLPRGVSIGVALAPDVIAGIAACPYTKQYLARTA